MKFLIYHNYIPKVGGIESVVYNLSSQLNKKGIQVTIACRSFQSIESLFKYSEVADVVVLTGKEKLNADVCLIASNHLKPAEVTAKKYLQWVHSDYSKYNLLLQKNPEVTTYIAVSKHCAEVFKKLYNIDCEVIYNLLPDDFGLEQNKGLKLLTNARISPEKGFIRMAVFVKGLEDAKVDYTWTICGDNTFDPQFEAQVKKQFENNHNIRFVGFQNDVVPYIKECDYHVMLSDFEGCPLSVLEALKLNKPCICTDWGGITELIKDGENGYIVPMNLHGVDYKKFLKIPEFQYKPVSTIDDWIKIIKH